MTMSLGMGCSSEKTWARHSLCGAARRIPAASSPRLLHCWPRHLRALGSAVALSAATAAGADAVGEFSLSCDATAVEGGTATCTLTNGGDVGANWPVAGIFHLLSDQDRALVRGVPLDVRLRNPSPAAWATKSETRWIGEQLVSYALFDWGGRAAPGAARTFSIDIVDDEDHEGAERFHVALAPSGSRHAGFLMIYPQRQTVEIAASDAASDDAGLEALEVWLGAGSPVDFDFAGSTRRYEFDAAYEETYVLVRPTASHGRATATVAGRPVPSGTTSVEVPLDPGTQTIAVEVTAEDGTTGTYDLVVTRAERPEQVTVSAGGFALRCPSVVTEGTSLTCTLRNEGDASADWPVVATIHGSMDAERAYVAEDTTSAGTAFSRDADLAQAQTPVADAYRHGYGELFSGGSFSHREVYGFQKFDWEGQAAVGAERQVTVAVADDGLEEATEVFYVALAPSGYTGLSELVENRVPVLVQDAVSTDATLGELALSGADIGTFASDTTVYAASVPHALASTTVTATTSHGGAEVEITPPDADGTLDGHQVSLAVGETVVAATVTAEDGETTQSYTVAVTRARSNDATLSGLALSGVDYGAFASGTTTYAAEVAHAVESTTVRPTASHPGARFAIAPADADLQTGGHQVSLAVGETVVSVAVTAADGISRQTYTVTVTRAASGDATLKSLELSGLDYGAFASGTTTYAAEVAHAVESTTVEAEASHDDAEVSIAPADADAAPGHQVSLAVGETVVAVEVTAADGETTETYTVTVTRAASGDATLKSLELSGLDYGAFASGTTTYAAEVAHAVESTTVEAEASHDDAEVSIAPADADAAPGHQVDLAVGETVVAVEVTAADGETTETYTVTVTRAVSDDATLSVLDLTGADIGTFSSGTTSYSAEVAHAVESTTVEAEASHDDAEVSIAPADADEAPGHQVDLAVGETVVAVEVTAADGETTETYTVTVTRAVSDDATLSVLELTGVDIGTFSSGTTSYSAEVAHAVESTTVEAEASRDDAEVSIAPADADEAPGHQVDLAVGETVVAVEVTAADGETTETYTVTVLRAPADDATLKSLELTGVDIGMFSSGTTSYSAEVAHAVESTTVEAEASHVDAEVSIAPGDADGAAPGHQVALAVGETAVTATVTAADGESTATYTVAVTRAASDDATLKSLSLTGVDIGTFESGTASYAGAVAHAVSSTTVSAAASHAEATVSVAGATAVADGWEVALVEGENEIAVTVTASDGATTKAYTVTVTRAASSDATLSSLSLTGVDFGTFSSGTASYSAKVTHAVETTTVEAEATHDDAEVSIAPADADAAPGHQVSLAVGETAVTATVTAPDGETTRTYTVSVARAKSDDAMLASLELTGVDIGTFASATTTYAADVAHEVQSTTVEAEASHDDAQVDIAPADADAAPGHQVDLAVGETVIAAEVTAADGETTATYAVTVTRAGSDDAALKSLSLTDVEIGAFDAETLEYAGATEAESTTVKAEPSHPEATVSVAGATEVADGWEVSLAEGGNEIAVEVTAQDGETARAYAVSVRRAPAGTAICRDGTALAGPEDNPELVRDCETLLSLKDELDPTGEMYWGVAGNERLDLGQWDAVVVRDGRVRGIAWDGTDSVIRVEGVLPAALGELDALEVLRLDRQSLRGVLPDSLRRLKRLEVLSLQHTDMDAEPLPAWLGEMTSLRELRLIQPEPGPIPDAWSALVGLEELRVTGGRDRGGATGPVPGWLGELPSLRRLQLEQQQLTGRIPLSLAREFELLDLQFNALEGCVPAQLADRKGVSVSRQGSSDERYHLPACALAVDAGAGREVSPGETVELSAAASGHHGDATLVWSWTQADNGAPAVALAGADTAAPSFAVPEPAGAADMEFAFEVEVSDVEQTSGSATAAVTYRLPGIAGTAAPAVSGAGSYEVEEGETAVATLTATDPDTAAEHLSWRLSGGADASHFALAGSGASSSLEFTSAKDYEAPDDADGDGVYAVSIEVSDGLQSGAADLAVALTNRNEAPAADAGADQADVPAGSTVTLSGSATDPDAGDTLTYAWTQLSGPTVALSSSTAPETTFVAPAAGTLRFRLRATDAGGLWGEDEVTVTMLAWGDRLPEHDIQLGGDEFTPSGIWSDGDTLWASSWPDGGVRAFALDGARRAGRDIGAGGYPVGLWSDGDTLWVADYQGGRLRAHRLSDGEALPDEDVATLKAAGNSRPTGLWSDGERLWTADYSSGGVYAYRLSDGGRDADAGFSFDVEEVRPFGLWSDGETALLSDLAGGRLLAYRLSDGARLPDLDIDTKAAGNARPMGLWSPDGPPETASEDMPEGVLWVSDEEGDKLYAYAIPSAEADAAGGAAPEAIPDAALAARSEGGGPGALTSLDLSGQGIADLTGIQAAAGLRKLDVSGNSIVNLGPLSGLRVLEELDIGGNLYLRNLAPLGQLANLRVLRAADNAIANVAPLARLAGLEELDVSGNMIRDASPLAALVGLRRLDIGGNAVANLAPLAGLAGARVLGLDDQLALSGSSPAAYLPDPRLRAAVAAALGKAPGAVVTEAEVGLLTALDWPAAGIADLRELSRATRLRALRLEGGRIENLWPLAELDGLRRLHLRGNAVRAVAALEGLEGLRVLDLGGNAVSDLRPLAELVALERLDLGGNPVRNLGALGDLGTLVWLRVPDASRVPADRLVRLRWLWSDDGECVVCPGSADER